MLNGRIGSDTSRSASRKAASSAAAPVSSSHVAVAPHPWVGAFTSANTSISIPPVASVDPSRSNRLVLTASRSAGRTARTAGTISAQAIGLTNITQRHPGPCTRAPPARIPIPDDSPATAPQIPSARARSEPVNVVVSVESAAGSINAAPMPWTSLATTNTPELPASPPVSDPTPTSAVPMSRTRLRPNRSARRPPSSIRPP